MLMTTKEMLTKRRQFLIKMHAKSYFDTNIFELSDLIQSTNMNY